MPILNDPANKNRTPLVLENNRRRDLPAFFSGRDIAHSSSQLLPAAVSVIACGCLTTIWKESWHIPRRRHISNRGSVAAKSVSKHCSVLAGLNSQLLTGIENQEGRKRISVT